MKLSKHFTLEQLTRSDYALRHGVDNTPSLKDINALRALCENTLEPIRAFVWELFGKELQINSGYRSPIVNEAVGGSLTSQHRKGQACDFEVNGVSHLQIIGEIVNREIDFDQIIFEGGEKGWIHVSWKSTKLRRELLKAEFKGGKAHYSPLVLLYFSCHVTCASGQPVQEHIANESHLRTPFFD